MTLTTVLVILHGIGCVMCAISMWADRKKFLTTRGAILTGVLLTLWPIVNYIAAVAVVIEGGWGEKEVKW